MTKLSTICLSVVGLLGLTHCSASGNTEAQGATGSGGSTAASGTTTGSGMTTTSGASTGAGGSSAICDQLPGLVAAYKAAHPGNGGKDWDITEKTPAQLANDPEAQLLLAQCTPDQLPIYPLLAWEYGGMDHSWINPQASALLYCVYVPVATSTQNWAYDPVANHVTADVYIKCPEHNPCQNEQGANQVTNCIGDMTNFEILVDTANYHDGISLGYDLSMGPTDLYLILDNGMKVHLFYSP